MSTAAASTTRRAGEAQQPSTLSAGPRWFGLLSKSSTLLVRVNPGQPGVAPLQRRAPGRGATAPAVDRRRRRWKSLSHRSWPGHSLKGSISMAAAWSGRRWPMCRCEACTARGVPDHARRTEYSVRHARRAEYRALAA
jgi:hypothetical protein